MNEYVQPEQAASALADIGNRQERVIDAVLMIAGLTVSMIFGVARGARVRSSELLGDRGALAIVGFVWLVVALTLGIGFGLRAIGGPAPATIATAAGGVALISCGPLLMRRLRQIMLGNRSGATK